MCGSTVYVCILNVLCVVMYVWLRFADTPCTTVGLWKYAAAYDIFKDVTLEDVEAALQLEGALVVLLY